jgi:hypothetical protein
MFVRIKRSGPREYLQIVENFREGRKVRQRVIANLGRLDILRATGALDSIATSLAQLSENVAVVSSIKEDNQRVEWDKEWGSFLVFRRLWQKKWSWIGFGGVEERRDRFYCGSPFAECERGEG